MKKIVIWGVLSILLAGQVLAEELKIVIGLPAGSGPDVITRSVAAELSVNLGKSVVIENRAGASGGIAMEYVSRKENKNVLLVAVSENMMSYHLLYNKDYRKDFIAVAPIFKNDMVLVTSSKTPSIDFVTAVRTNPKFGSWGVGSNAHIASLQFLDSVNLLNNAVHVPYRDFNNWYSDIYNKDLSFSFSTIPSTRAMFDTNKLKYIAVTSKQRSMQYPTIPTMKEVFGIDVVSIGWAAFYVNKDMPAADRLALEQALQKTISSKTVQDQIANMGYQTWGKTTLKQFIEYVREDTTNFEFIFAKYNIQSN